MSTTFATRIAEEFAANDSSPADLQRKRAAQEIVERGLPTSRDENWKYVNLRPLEKVRFAPPPRAVQPVITDKELPAPIQGYARYTFIDGVFAPQLSASVAQTGVSVTSLAVASRGATPPVISTGDLNGNDGAVVGDRVPGAKSAAGAPAAIRTAAALGGVDSPASSGLQTAPSPDLRFALLNEAFATDGALIEVAPGTDCQTCVELVFVATADAKAGSSYPRVDFRIGAGARVGLIERHVSFGSDANFINCAVDVDVARDASVKHYRLQQTGGRAIWFDTLTANLATNARYQLHTVNLGALSARSTLRVQLTGEHSEVGMLSASVGGKNQVHDTLALVEHVAPNAHTEQSFRGISSGRARVAYNGKIVVQTSAHGTDSRQSLRGLLAGADAEIDLRPQLEIYTDDVRCNHGATAGKLDDNMLFYLLSRGLDRETAQRLLKWAFLEDVVAKIEVPELRRQIEQSLAGQLNEAAALKGAPYTADGELHEQTPLNYGERTAPAKQELF